MTLLELTIYQGQKPYQIRPCQSTAEQMKATKIHHTEWISESSADVQCHFPE